MSVSIIQSNAILSSYEKASNYAKKYVSSTALDSIETYGLVHSISLAIGFASFVMTESFGTGLKTRLLRAAAGAYFGMVCGVFAMLKLQEIKRIIVQSRINSHIEDSLDLPKSMWVMDSLDFPLFAGYGPGGALVNYDSVDKIEKIAKKYSIYFSTETMEAQRLPKNEKHDALLLIGHGSQKTIQILKGCSSSIDELKDFKDRLSAMIKDQAAILLISCKTAKGDENIARQFSLLFPEATVYAPSDWVCDSGIQIDEEGMPSFSKSFYNSFGSCLCRSLGSRDITRVYKNGNLIVKDGKRLAVQ